jgi:ABC-type transport system substrate-binding protein
MLRLILLGRGGMAVRVRTSMSALRHAGSSVVLSLAILVAGCGGGAEDTSAATESASETPVRGGTLELIGDSDVDHLISSSAYTGVAYGLLRTFTRQLVSFTPAATFAEAKQLAPDLARELPTKENGGISEDGRTYTFHLRSGVMWDVTPPRAVTAADVVRGIEMHCNPVSPAGAPGYFRSTIDGVADFCDAFARVPGTAPAIEAFVQSHDIAGVSAPDDSTVVFRLLSPTPDFVNLLIAAFASPMPAEYLDYVPDGPEFRSHTISSGPYRIRHYVEGREIALGRNPNWNPASDPLRQANVDSIHVVMGLSAPSVQQQLEVGTADIAWDLTPTTADLSRLIAAKDPNLVIGPDGDNYVVITYAAINLLGNNAGGALRKLEVRQALTYAIDRTALVQTTGGPRVSEPLHQAVVSTMSGFRPGFDPYATTGARGDSAKSRALLAAAGYPNGVPIKLLYRSGGNWPAIAQTLQASLTRGGFQVELVQATTSDFWARYLSGPEPARRGVWDIAIATWWPDWFGNNGRAVIDVLYNGKNVGPGASNYGGYDNAEVNAAIGRALTAETQEESEQAWAEAATKVTEDVGIVPLFQTKSARYKSSRVKNCVFSLWSLSCDFTMVWLAGAAGAR